jgi:hypothetical protein
MNYGSFVVTGDQMSALYINQSAVIESFYPGQKVNTSFGAGVVEAFSTIDSIVYVTLSDRRTGLYLLRPEQVEVLSEINGQ